jgi:RNA polymerase-associated protein RTF1
MVSSWNAKENPELAGKDIGTQMAHMVEIDLPDF